MPVKKSVSLSVDVFNIKGKVIGKIQLPKEVFDVKASPKLIAQAVRVYLANKRGVGTATTKTRGEVRGSTRKIYRQKHTGRARHGAIRAPIFVGGGIVFGPKTRDYSLSLPNTMKKKALSSALTAKLKEEAIKVIDGLEKITPKTKNFSDVIAWVTPENNKKTLLVLPKNIENVKRAARNIQNITILYADFLNAYDIVKADTLLFTKSAIEGLAKRYADK